MSFSVRHLVNPQVEENELANAVSRVDNLSFLEDIVPRTTTVREYRYRKARSAAQERAQTLPNGQTFLDNSSNIQRPLNQGEPSLVVAEAMDVGSSEGNHSQTLFRPETQPQISNGQELVFQHYEPGGISRRDEPHDVEMG